MKSVKFKIKVRESVEKQKTAWHWSYMSDDEKSIRLRDRRYLKIANRIIKKDPESFNEWKMSRGAE